MIADSFRGSSWTNALLGLQAEEIHICGDERALKLIYDLLKETGDTLITKEYSRLGDLIVENKIINQINDLRKGDCIVSFNRRSLFQFRNKINSWFQDKNKKNEKNLGNRCSIIYGNLPPETKKFQAKYFNENLNNVEFLVATDAIGIGLNLNIRRIIFASLYKYNPNKKEKIQLKDHEIRQIAGRAGRSDSTGYVSALDINDLKTIKNSLKNTKTKRENRVIDEVQLLPNKFQPKLTQIQTQIEKACLFPQLQAVCDYAEALMKFGKEKEVDLKLTLTKFEEVAKVDGSYFMKDLSDIYEICKLMKGIKGLDIKTQYVFSLIPIRFSNLSETSTRTFVEQLLYSKTVKLPANFHLDNHLFKKHIYERNDLDLYESIHNVLEIYIFLSHHYKVEFQETDLAMVLKDRVCKIIDSIIQDEKYDLDSDLKREYTNQNFNKMKLIDE